MLQIRITESESFLFNCPDYLVTPLMKKFTYTNSSVAYQLYKLKKSKYRSIRAIMGSRGVNEVEAKFLYNEELRLLESQHKPCLLTWDNKLSAIRFPTGLLNRLVDFFKENGVNTKKSLVDLRKKPTEKLPFPIMGQLPLLRDYQREAVEIAISAGQGTIVSATGTGKTIIIQEIIRRLGLNTLVIVPSLSILDQTIDRFKKVFGRNMVGEFSGKKKRIRPITLACAASLVNTTKKDWKGFDVVCLDEAHHSPAETISHTMYNILPDVYYRFGFTATYHRTDGADLAIEAAVFHPIYTYTAEEGIKEGHLASPKFLMFNVEKNSYRSYSGSIPVFAYKHHILNNRFLNDLVVSNAQKMVESGKQVLILVKEKVHGHVLQKQIEGSVFVRTKDYSESKLLYAAPFVDVNDAVGEFNDGKIRCLIGTSVIGEGTDLVPVDVLINLMGGASKVSVMQNLGRALRTTPTKKTAVIIDYFHNTNQMLAKHSLSRYNLYKKLGPVSIVDLK